MTPSDSWVIINLNLVNLVKPCKPHTHTHIQVQKTFFSSNNWRTMCNGCSYTSITTKKNFKSKFIWEPSAHSHALFFDFLIQGKLWKMDFSAFCFHFMMLEPPSFNINRRKAFCLLRFSNLSDHTQPDFMTTPFFTRENMKTSVLMIFLPFYDVETTFL